MLLRLLFTLFFNIEPLFILFRVTRYASLVTVS